MKVVRKVGRGIGKTGKFLFNVPGWMGLKEIKASGKGIADTAKGLFYTYKSDRQETFDEAVVRLHLSEQDIQQRMKGFFKAALVYTVIALGLFLYTIYLLIGVYLGAAIISFLLSLLALTLAFRQHFYYFQMKQRRLGCTIKQWFHFLVGARQ
jgi:intracellular multiplication protein IcmV